MHSTILLATLVTVVLGAPQGFRQEGPYEIIPIVSYSSNGPLDGGAYNFAYESADGTVRKEEGAPNGPKGAVISKGEWSFTFPDGSPGKFSFVADEGGYRVESPLLPTPPPMPDHAIEQIKRGEEERAAGIRYDQQGFRINK